MKLLIDNTGLHSAARTIFGNAKAEIDVKSLIQFSTLLIFADKLNLGGLEDDSVANKTSEILYKLSKLGINNKIVSVPSVDIELFKSACKETALQCAKDLELIHKKNEDINLIGLRPDGLALSPNEEAASLVELVTKNYIESDLVELQKNFLEKKMEVVVHYMIIISPELRASLKKLITQNSEISLNKLNQINVFLRFHLNETIAKHRRLKYSPAIARACLVRKANNFIINQLSNSIDKAVEKFIDQKLDVPSLTKYLVEKSKGSPERMIEVALKTRENAKKIRKWLNKLIENKDYKSGEFKFEIHQKMDELSEILLTNLGINTPKISDALEFSLSYGVIPDFKLNINKFIMWLKSQRNKKRYVLLTEISKENIFSELKINPNELSKFIS